MTENTEQLIRHMLDVHPRKPAREMDEETLIDCIEACIGCGQAATACADASLGERDLSELTRSIRLCIDCAAVCEVTAQVLTRQTETSLGLSLAQVTSCLEACRACGAECSRHAGKHEHHRVCADACRRCEQACSRLLASAKTEPRPEGDRHAVTSHQ